MALVFCPEATYAQDENGLSDATQLDTTVNLIRPYKGRLETEKRALLLGDIDGDKVKDSAFIAYRRVIGIDSTYQKACGQNVCYSTIKFQGNIPEIIIEAYSIDVKPVADVNGDGNEDILIFRELQQYNWGLVGLYSFYGNSWKLLGEVEAFLSDDAAYDNRVIKSGSQYYLVADVWNKDYSEIKKKNFLIRKKPKK